MRRLLPPERAAQHEQAHPFSGLSRLFGQRFGGSVLGPDYVSYLVSDKHSAGCYAFSMSCCSKMFRKESLCEDGQEQ